MKRYSYFIGQTDIHFAERRQGQMYSPSEGPARIRRGKRSGDLAPRREHAIVIRPTRSAVTTCRKTVRADRPRWIRWVASLPARLWSNLIRGNERRQAGWALYALDDRMLKDIGISRSDIEYLQHGGPTEHIIR
jgi:uncharacterized protein YjiS (DUF1127 family)